MFKVSQTISIVGLQLVMLALSPSVVLAKVDCAKVFFKDSKTEDNLTIAAQNLVRNFGPISQTADDPNQNFINRLMDTVNMSAPTLLGLPWSSIFVQDSYLNANIKIQRSADRPQQIAVLASGNYRLSTAQSFSPLNVSFTVDSDGVSFSDSSSPNGGRDDFSGSVLVVEALVKKVGYPSQLKAVARASQIFAHSSQIEALLDSDNRVFEKFIEDSLSGKIINSREVSRRSKTTTSERELKELMDLKVIATPTKTGTFYFGRSKLASNKYVIGFIDATSGQSVHLTFDPVHIEKLQISGVADATKLLPFYNLVKPKPAQVLQDSLALQQLEQSINGVAKSTFVSSAVVAIDHAGQGVDRVESMFVLDHWQGHRAAVIKLRGSPDEIRSYLKKSLPYGASAVAVNTTLNFTVVSDSQSSLLRKVTPTKRDLRLLALYYPETAVEVFEVDARAQTAAATSAAVASQTQASDQVTESLALQKFSQAALGESDQDFVQAGAVAIDYQVEKYNRVESLFVLEHWSGEEVAAVSLKGSVAEIEKYLKRALPYGQLKPTLGGVLNFDVSDDFKPVRKASLTPRARALVKEFFPGKNVTLFEIDVQAKP